MILIASYDKLRRLPRNNHPLSITLYNLCSFYSNPQQWGSIGGLQQQGTTTSPVLIRKPRGWSRSSQLRTTLQQWFN
ncbi:hypothetical protein LOAG_03546 [Loa loa]|uniref:Uncharacterized protein n=1 Tax=Loa loa TaxID=7209 RepID=A0A1S0U487_LOALO|nr:hypothetical protein LOAG_03546 [Loa loa]EFO24939.1 hypothetical protein LOAG_03546 [Loa loa]